MSVAMRKLSNRFPELVDSAIADAFRNRGFLTWNDGIEMWTLDRPVASCTHCTSFCRRHCYTNKAYVQYHHIMPASDIKNEYRWGLMTGNVIAAEIEKKNRFARSRKITRIRFCAKGEPFSDLSDIDLIKDIALNCPEVLFWTPTRAWRHGEYREKIETGLLGIDNLKIMASLDPSNSMEEAQNLRAAGWSIMFFGIDDVYKAKEFFGIEFAECHKTHFKEHGFCQTCRLCFCAGQTFVHLKKH